MSLDVGGGVPSRDERACDVLQVQGRDHAIRLQRPDQMHCAWFSIDAKKDEPKLQSLLESPQVVVPPADKGIGQYTL